MPAIRARPDTLPTGLLLAAAGGFLDAYTFVGRGGVFANAQTGNIVLLGVEAGERHWLAALLHVPPILAFVLGVALAETLARPAGRRRALSRLCSRDDGTQVSRRQQMVKMRHIAEIPDLGFAGLPPGLEVMTLADLRGRAADCMSADFMRPQRLTLSPCSGAGCGTLSTSPATTSNQAHGTHKGVFADAGRFADLPEGLRQQVFAAYPQPAGDSSIRDAIVAHAKRSQAAAPPYSIAAELPRQELTR